MLIDNGKVIVEESDFVETLSGPKPCIFVLDANLLVDYVVINEIAQHYSNHPSIRKIREMFGNSQTIEKFHFYNVKTFQIYKLPKNIDDKKATGMDKIPPKLVKISAEVLSQPLADAINNL